MARLISFTKNELLKKTGDFVKKYGMESLNARDLCKYIGCSTQPLFRNFNNMEELKKELKVYLHDYYNEFIFKIVKEDDYLYTISCAYALFAFKEPRVFKALFMSNLAGQRTIQEVLETDRNVLTIKAMVKQYNISFGESQKIYRDVRFYTHGIATQLAIGSIIIKEKELQYLIRNNININLERKV